MVFNILFFVLLNSTFSFAGTRSIYVTLKPSGANIFLDNNPSGNKTDFLIENIPTGPHKIVVEHPEYGKAERAFEIKSGLATAIHIELRPQEVKDAAVYHSRGFTIFRSVHREGGN